MSEQDYTEQEVIDDSREVKIETLAIYFVFGALIDIFMFIVGFFLKGWRFILPIVFICFFIHMISALVMVKLKLKLTKKQTDFILYGGVVFVVISTCAVIAIDAIIEAI